MANALTTGGKKGKKKKLKNKKETGKAALGIQEVIQEEEEQSEEESEEDSPVQPSSGRAARVRMAKRALFRPTTLHRQLSNMNEEETKKWGEGVFQALRDKSARSPNNPTVQGKMWSKRNGERWTDVAAIMESGCTHPLTTFTVTEAIRKNINPLTRPIEIVEASGDNLKILGTVQAYLECEVLGGRKLVEAAVIEGEGASEVLVSLGLMKKWDLIHDSFPQETVSDFLTRMTNKTKIAYSSLYSFNNGIHNESKKLVEPS